VTQALERRRKKLNKGTTKPRKKKSSGGPAPGIARQRADVQDGTRSSPSPRPSPSGRGGIVSQMLENSKPRVKSSAGNGPYPSLGERAKIPRPKSSCIEPVNAAPNVTSAQIDDE